ncbi:target of rapamycin (TOR) kinase 1 [Trypanosoma cruzi]|nr:target of rapamycin (TOR) kinase 1 [Trypanosoma cruzi]
MGEETFFYHAGRGARGTLGLIGLSAILPPTTDVWVDNTSLRGAANKGSPKSHVMTWELRRIYEFLESCRLQASFAYVRSAENPADGMPRGRVFYTSGLHKRERRGVVARGPQSLPIRK